MRANLIVASLAILAATQYQVARCAKLDQAGLTDMLRPMSKSCQKKNSVNPALIEATHNGEFAKDKSLGCYFRCLSQMLKIMNKQGEVTIKDVNRQIDLLVVDDLAPKLKAVTGLCVEKIPQKSDTCLYALELISCGYNVDKDLYFLP